MVVKRFVSEARTFFTQDERIKNIVCWAVIAVFWTWRFVPPVRWALYALTSPIWVPLAIIGRFRRARRWRLAIEARRSSWDGVVEQMIAFGPLTYSAIGEMLRRELNLLPVSPMERDALLSMRLQVIIAGLNRTLADTNARIQRNLGKKEDTTG